MADEFDFVVIGAGTAGCLVTARLSAAGHRVCLIEAGPRDWNPLIHIPAGYIRNVYSKTLTWNFMSEPGGGVAGRSFSLPQGRVLGGSSSINGLNYVRGQAEDYDGWAAAGNPGWRYADVLPFFRRTEQRVGGGDPAYRGYKGEIPVTDLDWRHPVNEALIGAAEALQIPRNPDYNGAKQEGAGYFQRTIHRGWRVSSASAFLSSARRSGAADIRTGCQVTRILVNEGRAQGVVYRKGGPRGAEMRVMARREVILSAGALNTPKLAQLSGIGAPDLLRERGIDPVHALPGVGLNLRDHYAVRMVARVKGARTINNMARGPALLGQIARWLAGRPSLLAVSPSLVHIFCRSDPSQTRPDLEFACAPASFREGVVGLLDKHPGLTLGVWQERPESLGHVRIKSADPFEAPAIQPNYLTHETDRKVLVNGMRIARRLFRAAPLAPYIAEETSPPASLETDDELLDFARTNGTTVYHMIGTMRMGPAENPDSVTDHRLRLHGLSGLRAVDASIMPSMPSANTNASTLMIAEKAARMILEDARS